MIDTIKLKIPITHVDFDDITKNQKVHFIVNFKGELTRKQCSLGFVYSNGQRIHMFANYNEEAPHHELYLEFSIPKLVYGQNVYLYYPDQLLSLLEQLRQEMGEWFKVKFVPVTDWVINRLDLCYAWKLPSQDLAQSLLESLRGYSFPRKTTAHFETSIAYQGKAYSGIFYLKHPEYVAKGFKDLRYRNLEYAEAINLESQGVLRFEMQLKKAKLNDLFKDKKGGLQLKDLQDRDFLSKTLNSLFFKLIRSNEIRIDSPAQIYEKLKTSLGDEKKAKHLLMFHQMYMGSIQQKLCLKMIYNNSTITRNLKTLSESGVGVSIKDFPITSLSIPSNLVINTENAPFAVAREQVKKPVQELLLPVPGVEEEAW